MAGTFIPSEREKIFIEDVQTGTSVSEAVGNKIGAAVNHIIDRILQTVVFGGIGRYFNNAVYPVVGWGANEIMVEDIDIADIQFTHEIAGISGQTEIDIEVRRFGTTVWTSLFLQRPIISSAAVSGVSFNTVDLTPITGVTLPVLDPDELQLFEGDELRATLISAMDQAQNYNINVRLRPRSEV